MQVTSIVIDIVIGILRVIVTVAAMVISRTCSSRGVNPIGTRHRRQPALCENDFAGLPLRD